MLAKDRIYIHDWWLSPGMLGCASDEPELLTCLQSCIYVDRVRKRTVSIDFCSGKLSKASKSSLFFSKCCC